MARFFHFARLSPLGGTLLATGIAAVSFGQTLPIAGNAQEAVAKDRADRQAILQRAEQRRDGIRGVREQDNAARQTAQQLNRDARQDAREQALTGQSPLAVADQGSLQSNAALNANLRPADLGVWLNNQRGNTGLVVSDIANASLFAQAGLLEGDRILSINGRPVTSDAQFVQMLLAPGQLSQSQNATIVVLRDGRQETLTLQPSLLARSVIAADPFYQTGLIVDQSNPNQLVVQQVFPRTAAFYAGLRPGDVITGLNGDAVTSADAFSRALTTAGGSDLALSINRNGQTRQLTLDASGDGSIRTAQRTDAGITGSALNSGTTTTGGIGTTAGGTATSIGGVGTAAGGTGIGGAGSTAGLNTSGAGAIGISPSATAPLGPTTANPAAAPGTPTSPSLSGAPTSPSLTTQPNIGPAGRTAVPGLPTAVPGRPTAGPGSLAPSATGQGGNISTATPTLPTTGSATATGATGTTGGAGATAGGIGATGGTGSTPGGTGSTAGPSGGATGSAGTGGTGAGAGGTGSGAGGAGAGAGGT